MTTLIESPHFDLTHDEGCDCLYATWRGIHGAPLTQANYKLVLEFVQATASKRILNDSLHDQDGWKQLINWIADNYYEQLAELGVIAVAWVLPRNREALHAARQVLDKLEKPLVETFGDGEAAYNWLQQWPKSAAPRARISYL